MKLFLLVAFVGAAYGLTIRADSENEVQPEAETVPEAETEPVTELVPDTTTLAPSTGPGRWPSCAAAHDNIRCCSTINVAGRNTTSCVRLAFVPANMTFNIALQINDRVIREQNTRVGRTCSPLPPPLTMFSGCLDVYYADVSPQNRSADVCAKFELRDVTGRASLLQLSFDCIRYRNRSISLNNDVRPQSSSMININFNQGVPSIVVEPPTMPSFLQRLPTIPGLPTLTNLPALPSLPNIQLPNIQLPTFQVPNIQLPNIQLPNIQLPNLQNIPFIG